MDTDILWQIQRMPPDARRRIRRAVRRGDPLDDALERSLAYELASEADDVFSTPLLARIKKARWPLLAAIAGGVLLSAMSERMSLIDGLVRGLALVGFIVLVGQALLLGMRRTVGRNVARARMVNAPDGDEALTETPTETQ